MWNCLPGNLRALAAPLCKVEIHQDAFKGLNNLRSLYLSGNSLTSLPWLPPSLTVLGLDLNHIYDIVQPFKTPLLQQLNLSKNCYYANPCNQSFYIHEDVFRDLPKLESLNLGYNNLTAVPAGLPSSLVILDLKENTISEIKEGDFSNLTNLRNLNLEWNCQRCDHAARPCFPCPNNAPLSLQPKSLYIENSSLFYLSLRGNSLRTFPVGFFRSLSRLKKLDLSDNLLAFAMRNGTFFAELRSLTWISLIYNYEPLKTFSELILSPHLGEISGLKTLLLSGNFFHTLSMQSLDILAKLRQLVELELRMNFISSCNMTVLSQLHSLTTVILSQNMLTFFACNANKSSESNSLQIMQNQASFMSHTIPETIVLPDRRIISAGLWETQEQETMVISDNDKDIPQIPTMWDFKRKFCENQLFFDLSQNDILSINRNVFKGMEKAVCLDLSYNYMSQTLKSGQFLPISKLVYLNLAYNRIDLYFKEAFMELNATLKALDLSSNDFHFQMRGMGHRFDFIQNLPLLEALSFSNNGIGMRIDHELNSTSLKYLYFSGNRLDIMWDSSSRGQYVRFFQNLVNLIYLDISENQLRSLSPDMLSNLPISLRALSVSRNFLNYFPWDNITSLSNLRHLNLSANHIAHLTSKVIDFGANLYLLDLSHNRIGSLPEKFFSKALSLRYLYLDNNVIKHLNHLSLPDFLGNISALQMLTLHNNQFDCTCNSSWFADHLRTSNVEIPHLTTYVRCEFPESLQGESVVSMDRRSCQEIFGSFAFLLSSFLAIAVTAMPLLKHLYGWDLWYCLQVLWAAHKGYSQLPGKDIRSLSTAYDAFVVFDTENQAVRDWVYNELLVQLENTGDRKFCLSLEERDWVPGLSCIENLHSAVYNSRKTIFVLTSDHFGASVNGVIRQAFFMVQQRLLDEKVDVAMLVLLGKVFPKLRYLQLRKRLCRKSVLSWPTNPRAQPLFWSRMRMALSSDNLRNYDSNMSESFI
ncbi:toll-like receptor 9 [Aplochiton taeniatus]